MCNCSENQYTPQFEHHEVPEQELVSIPKEEYLELLEIKNQLNTLTIER